uniref:AMP-activated protein kinase glycogen-binding domain-containing protein n=1 Tax=Globodera rostochiensis TaxID=31243 RepID=A0A914H272_GLORO
MGNRKRIFAGRILSFPSFRKHRAKSPDAQHKSQNGVVLKAAEGVREVGGTSLVVVVGGETKVHQTERNRELEEIESKFENKNGVNTLENDTKEEDEHQQREKDERTAESDRIVDKRDRTVHFGEGEVVFAGSDGGGGKENGRWTKDDDRLDQEWDEADEGRMGSDLEDNVEEVEEVVERERLRWHQLHRQQNGRTTAANWEWELDDAARLTKDDEGQQNLGELQQFQVGDGEEKGGEEQMTDGNEQRSLEASERPLENVYLNGSLKEEVENMRLALGKLEQKLKDSNQERDYYKKHFKGENEGAHNGRGQLTDDFGKELMMANKRKYQLESKIKQLELELREAQQRALHLGESVKSMEKLLWLEKERSATLDREREQLRAEELSELSGGEDVRVAEFGGESQQEVATRLRAEQEQRYNELCNLKNKVEWRLGEVSQQCHDTKWRLGEVEATLAHRDWELDQANNRIKQLETSVAATPSATINDELERLREELTRKVEEKSKVEWKLGEVNQCWNDAKWRLGELEAETAHRSHLLDRAHHHIGELERRLENNLSYEDMRREKEALEDRLNELSKTLDGTKWRVGELEAELSRKGEMEEQKRKLEWRLDEMTHWWNDAKWRIGELESGLGHKERRNGVGDEQNITVTLDHRLKELLRDGTLLIRKQPHLDRHKWKLLTFENALKEEVRLRRCWFDADSEGHKEVFLIGSFVNWECALLCEPFPERPSRRGLWLDLPPGRYEFRFLRDGFWHTESGYAECWSEHGTKNNWMNVE